MDTEQSATFNSRLSQWVSSQGFWFQLRYSMSGGGSKAVLGFHLLRLGARLAIFLVVAAIGLWVYLVKLPGTARFQMKLKEAIAAGLGAKEYKMEGFKQEQGHLAIQRWVGVGGNRAFYSAVEARNIKCQLGLLTV